MNKSLDEMIKSYSDELMSFAKKNNTESLVMKPESGKRQDTDSNQLRSQAEPAPEKQVQTVKAEERRQEESEEKKTEEIPREEDMENYASFRARVFSGLEAYPVEKAKVIIYKNDILYAFLLTDKNGETEQIKIEAYPEKNSLEPLSDEQRIDYSADIYAEGFTKQENLLVSAVGGSEIVLNMELIPESERIN